jgi:hypothetical protein
MTLADRAATLGLALRGGFHPEPGDDVPPLPDGRAAGTLLLLGWTGPIQWPHFAASPEYVDRRPDRLDRWSRRVIGVLSAASGGHPLFPFGGPPHLPFQRWAMRAEPVHPSPVLVLIHPDWGLWHAWRGALAFAEPLPLPPRDTRPSPCESCAAQPCRAAADFDVARRACPIGTPYGDVQAAFHIAAFETVHGRREASASF